MKMIFAMLHSEDVDETVEELNKEKYWVTKLSTTGGFLKNKNVTLVIGTEDEQVPGALKILKLSLQPRTTLGSIETILPTSIRP